MLNPGMFTLGDFSITSAGTQTGDWVEDLEGMIAALAHLRFQYGSGGTAVKAYLQTTCDDGTTVIDTACVVFNVASETEVLNFSALSPRTLQISASDGALTDDTAIDGILGTKLRLKVVSTGTYASDTILSGRVVVR